MSHIVSLFLKNGTAHHLNVSEEVARGIREKVGKASAVFGVADKSEAVYLNCHQDSDVVAVLVTESKS